MWFRMHHTAGVILYLCLKMHRGNYSSRTLPVPGSALLSSQQCARGRSRQGCLQVIVSMFLASLDFLDSLACGLAATFIAFQPL